MTPARLLARGLDEGGKPIPVRERLTKLSARSLRLETASGSRGTETQLFVLAVERCIEELHLDWQALVLYAAATPTWTDALADLHDRVRYAIEVAREWHLSPSRIDALTRLLPPASR
jgi:hypothetical protein